MPVKGRSPGEGLRPVGGEAEAPAALTRRESMAAIVGGAVAAASPASAQDKSGPFRHGVASGDPDQTSIVLWTRVSPDCRATAVHWKVAHDPALRELVCEGRATAVLERDHCVKVLAKGLQPGRTYYFNFSAEGYHSPVGRTRTLPDGDFKRLGIALLSCSNYALGYFNAYHAVAGDPSIDFLLHIGDYIYEYGNEFASQSSFYVRPCDPPHETITLDDYRRRHAITKSDRHSQAMHAAHPLIALWDDHEFGNDAWREGAQNHDPQTEGDWTARRNAAVQAYYEWMPVRDPEPEAALENWRVYRFGNLATLVTLEARLTARDQPVDYGPHKAALKTRADAKAFVGDVLGNSPRQMISERTKAALRKSLGRSVQEGEGWQLVASPVLMARVATPPLRAGGLRPEEQPQLAFLDKFTDLFWRSDLGLPDSLDSWDGYAGARQDFYRLCRDAGTKNLVVLSGDSHAFWSNRLFDDAGDAMGIELGTAGVTSPNIYLLGQVPASTIETIDRLTIAENPEVRWTSSAHRGYIRVLLSQRDGRADFVAVPAERDGYYASRLLYQQFLTPNGRI
jgi:alkaline phosphatase D